MKRVSTVLALLVAALPAGTRVAQAQTYKLQLNVTGMVAWIPKGDYELLLAVLNPSENPPHIAELAFGCASLTKVEVAGKVYSDQGAVDLCSRTFGYSQQPGRTIPGRRQRHQFAIQPLDGCGNCELETAARST